MHHGLRGLWDAPSFFPYSHTLLYSDHLLGVALFTAPIQWATRNPILAYNAAFLASFIVSGAGMYVLARELTGRRDAAMIAGVIYACQPFRTSHFAHLQWLITGWLPLSLRALHRYFAVLKARWLAASSAFFLLQAFTAAYVAYFALLPLAIAGIFEWWRTRRPTSRVVRDAVPALALALVVMLPVVKAYADVRATLGLRRSADEIVQMSADVGDYFSAPPSLRLWGGLGSGRGEHELFPGALALALGVFGLVAIGRTAAASVHASRIESADFAVCYAFVLVAAFVLSLGPAPSAWGHRIGVPGPYAWLLRVVPGLDGLRAPARLAVVVQVALAVLAAFGAAFVLDRIPARRRAAAAGLAQLRRLSARPRDRRG